MSAPAKITVRLTNSPDIDGHYAARVYTQENGGEPRWDKTFFEYDRQEALDKATAYVAWLRDHDDSEQEIEL